MSDENTASAPEMLDRYELVALLARGGMGSVHLARLPGAGGFQRLYAIKVMHPHLAEEEEFVNMLLDEARIAARIHHPNAVPIVDVCHSPRGFYLVMDYIDGVTLSQLSAAAARQVLPWRVRVRAAIRVVLDALAGLHAAHELSDDEGTPLGLVHRDVSPQNIMVGSDGVGRITDFGIALAASRIVSSRPGLIKGKPSYMPPEQVMAQPVDRRADVFAMGIVLWESLTGARLFQAETESGALMQVIGAPIDAPRAVRPEVPESLDAVCMKALQRPVADRWESARAMALALEAAASAEGLLASAHEVADLLRTAFASEFSARRALIRDHARGTGSRSAPRIPAPVAQPAEAFPQTVRIPSKSDSRSIPAIEVPSYPPGAPVPHTLNLGVRDTDAAPPPRPRRPAWVAPALAFGALVLISGAAVAMRSHPAPIPPRPAAPVAHAPPATPPVPAIAPAPAPTLVAPTLVAPTPAAQTPAALVPAEAAPTVAANAAATARRTPTGRHGRRDEADAASPARPTTQPALPATQPAQPTIEENPYLRR